MLTQEMIEESSFYQMILEKGIAKGIAMGLEKGVEEGVEKRIVEGVEKGMEAGRLEEARRSVRLVLGLRFPVLRDLPEVDSINDPDRLEKLLEAIVLAKDLESVRSAVQQADGKAG